jgi:hypothetical protein
VPRDADNPLCEYDEADNIVRVTAQPFMTAAEIYESVTNRGASDFAELAAVLNRSKPWCLIGRLAVNCCVEPVYTGEVNLIVVAANLPKIERELEAAGFKVTWFERSTDAERITVPVASLENIVRGKVWAKHELDLMRIAEAHPDLRELIPTEIVNQL